MDKARCSKFEHIHSGGVRAIFFSQNIIQLHGLSSERTDWLIFVTKSNKWITKNVVICQSIRYLPKLQDLLYYCTQYRTGDKLITTELDSSCRIDDLPISSVSDHSFITHHLSSFGMKRASLHPAVWKFETSPFVPRLSFPEFHGHFSIISFCSLKERWKGHLYHFSFSRRKTY